MLEAKVRNVWLVGIVTCPLLLALFTTMLTARGAGAPFSFAYAVGTSIGNLVIGSLPALIAAMVYKFKKERQLNIFYIWTAGVLIVCLLNLLGTLKS